MPSTTVVAPTLIRGLWGLPASHFQSDETVNSVAKLAALQRGISYCAARNMTLIIDKMYRFPLRLSSANLTAHGGFLTHNSGCNIEGLNNCGFDMSECPPSGERRTLLRATGLQSPDPTNALLDVRLTADAAKGDTTIAVGSAGMATLGLTVGSRVSIQSNRVFIAGGTASAEKQGEISTVVAVTSTSFQIEPPLFDDYAMADSARVVKLTMHKGRLSNLILRGCGFWTGNVEGDRGIDYRLSDNLVIEDVRTEYLDSGNYLYSCPDLRVDNFSAIFGEVADDGLGGTTRTVNQYGLGIANACQDAVIQNCHITNGKHGIVQTEGPIAQGVTRRLTIKDCTVRGTWQYGIAAHTNAENIEVRFNKIVNCLGGIEAGCRNFRSEGNVVELTRNVGRGNCFAINDIAEHVVSVNDRFYGGRFAVLHNSNGSGDNVLFSGSAGPKKLHFIDTYAEGFSQDGISLTTAAPRQGDDVLIRNLVVRNAGNGIGAPQAIDIQGPWGNVIIDGGDFEGNGSGGAACILLGADVTGQFRGTQRWSGTFAAPSVSGPMRRNFNTANTTWTSIAAGATATRDLFLPEAPVGQPVSVGFATALEPGLIAQVRVSAPGLATVSITNITGGALTPFGGAATATSVTTRGQYG